MLNHNLSNKITEQYIQDRIEESKKRIYFYSYTYYLIDYSRIRKQQYGFIDADSKKDIYVKVFDKMPRIYGGFVRRNKFDKIFKKYVDKWGYNNKNTEKNDIRDAVEFFNNTDKLDFEEEDIDYINYLKFNYIEGILINLIYDDGEYINVYFMNGLESLIIDKY